jgi:hypothetical protein
MATATRQQLGFKAQLYHQIPSFSRFQGCSGPVPLRFWGPENTKSAQLPDPEIALRISHRSSGSHVGIRGAVGHINQIGSTKRRPVRIKNASPQRREAEPRLREADMDLWERHPVSATDLLIHLCTSRSMSIYLYI